MTERPIRFLASGQPDGRGRSEGSKAGQFAHGDGRKRPGRTKGSQSEKALVQALLNKRIRDPKSGKRKSVREAILYAQATRALKGDPRSTAYLQKLADRYEIPNTDTDRTAKLLAEDQFILDSLQARGLLSPPEAPPADESGGE